MVDTQVSIRIDLVIWNASSPHYRRALADSKGERLWRTQVREAGRLRRWC
jgi:hypothetical protein